VRALDLLDRRHVARRGGGELGGDVGREQVGSRDQDGPRDAPEDAVEQALRFLGLLRGVVTVGSFVFVLSDFLIEISDDAWGGILGRGWDVVPVVIQDPVWEHTFPPVGGVAATFSDVGGDRLLPTRLTAGEVERLRRRNEERRASILETFAAAGLDYVEVSSGDPVSIHASFLRWADERLVHGGRLG